MCYSYFCLFTDVLTETFPEARGDVNRRVTRWLSGARDRRNGSEPARKKRRVEPQAREDGRSPRAEGSPEEAVPANVPERSPTAGGEALSVTESPPPAKELPFADY